MIELFGFSFSNYYGYGIDIISYSSPIDDDGRVRSLFGISYFKDTGLLVFDICFYSLEFK